MGGEVEATRTCISCRAELPRREGLRFVLDGEGHVLIDVRAKAPGRGAWVCWSRGCIDGVRQKGRFERAFERAVVLPPAPWPLDVARAQIERRQGEFLGLAMRAGQLKVGGSVIESVVRSHWAAAVVLAHDAGDTVASDHRRRAFGAGVECLVSMLDSAQIGRALGKDGPRSAVALSRGNLVDALRTELKRGADLL